MFEAIYAGSWCLALIPLMLALYHAKSPLLQIYIGGLLFVCAMLGNGGINKESSELSHVLYILSSNITLLSTLLIIQSKEYGTPNHTINKINEHTKSSEIDSNSILSMIYAIAACTLLIYGAGGINNILSVWTQVGEGLSENTGYRITSMVAFILAISHILAARYKRIKIKNLIPAAVLLIIFALLIRVKIFIAPVVFAMIFPADRNKLSISKMTWALLIFILSYTIVMFFRWLGDLESISQDSAIDIFKNVSDAGIERELYDQFSSIMNFFQNHTSRLGASYQRLILLPVDIIFGTKFAPENPMYENYEIFTGISSTGGSAHPTIYADAFAEFSLFGILIPATYLVILRKLENITRNLMIRSIILSSIFIALPLIVRGSTFYGILYMISGILLGIAVSLIYSTHRFTRNI